MLPEGLGTTRRTTVSGLSIASLLCAFMGLLPFVCSTSPGQPIVERAMHVYLW